MPRRAFVVSFFGFDFLGLGVFQLRVARQQAFAGSLSAKHIGQMNARNAKNGGVPAYPANAELLARGLARFATCFHNGVCYAVIASLKLFSFALSLTP